MGHHHPAKHFGARDLAVRCRSRGARRGRGGSGKLRGSCGQPPLDLSSNFSNYLITLYNLLCYIIVSIAANLVVCHRFFLIFVVNRYLGKVGRHDQIGARLTHKVGEEEGDMGIDPIVRSPEFFLLPGQIPFESAYFALPYDRQARF